MDRPFDSLWLWIDEAPRQGAVNMAIDEALLRNAEAPILRTYLWDRPTRSIGIRQDPARLAGDAAGGAPVVRRPTGGGLVAHGRGDATYGLAIPPASPLAVARPRRCYEIVHASLASALRELGIQSSLGRGAATQGMGEVCFESPVTHDLLGPDGRKIAGAAQRRTRAGVLQQGSIQLRLPPWWGRVFADRLCVSFRDLANDRIAAIVRDGQRLAG